MRIWAIERIDGRIAKDTVRDFSGAPPLSLDELNFICAEVCREMDTACPVVLSSHLRDYNSFLRAVFKPDDFMEQVGFDLLEILSIDNKKKKN